MTETSETDLEPTAISLRLPKGLVAKIDERAKNVGMSRNAWLLHATTYVIEQLPTDAPIEDRRKARGMWLAGEL